MSLKPSPALFQGLLLTIALNNAALVVVTVPASNRKDVTRFVAELEDLTIETDREARVVVNERTGTIVMGKDVTLMR